MANHCVTTPCIFCGIGFCQRCSDSCECGKRIGEDEARKKPSLAEGLSEDEWKIYYLYNNYSRYGSKRELEKK